MSRVSETAPAAGESGARQRHRGETRPGQRAPRRRRQAPRRDDRAARRRPRDRAGRVLRAARPVGLGQDDDAAHPRRARDGERGPRADGRRRRDDAGAGRARRRDGVPELRALSAHDGRAEHRLPAEDGRHAGRRDRARGRRRGRARSASATCCSARPASSRAASSSAARWRARSCASRACSCSTSRCRTSTPSCGSRRGSSCTRLQRSLGATTVYVTHDQEEAMTLADRIAVFMDGRIVAGRHAARDLRDAADGRRRRLHRHAADEPAARRPCRAARSPCRSVAGRAVPRRRRPR